MHSSPTKTLKPKLDNRVASIKINNSLSHNAFKSCLIKNPQIYKIQKRSLSYICVVKDKSSSVTKLYLPTQINKIIKRFTGGKKITDATKIAAETAAETMQKVSPVSSHTVLTKKPIQDSSNTHTTQYSKILDEKQNDDIKAMQDNFDKNKQYQKDAAIPKSIKDNPGVQAKLKTMADKNNSNNTPKTNKEQDEFSKANKNTTEIPAEETEQKVNNPLETGINTDVPTNINNSSPKFKSGVLAGIQTSIEQQQYQAYKTSINVKTNEAPVLYETVHVFDEDGNPTGDSYERIRESSNIPENTTTSNTESMPVSSNPTTSPTVVPVKSHEEVNPTNPSGETFNTEAIPNNIIPANNIVENPLPSNSITPSLTNDLEDFAESLDVLFGGNVPINNPPITVHPDPSKIKPHFVSQPPLNVPQIIDSVTGQPRNLTFEEELLLTSEEKQLAIQEAINIVDQERAEKDDKYLKDVYSEEETKPTILLNQANQSFSTTITKDTKANDLTLEQLLLESKKRLLINKDNKTSSMIEVDDGTVVEVGAAKNGMKITSLGHAYFSELGLDRSPILEPIPDNLDLEKIENVELKIIVPPEPSINMVSESAKQKHLLVAYNASTQEYIALGYFTSKKGAIIICDKQIKAFQQEQNGLIPTKQKEQRIVIFDVAEKIPARDVQIIQYSQEYLDSINKKELQKAFTETNITMVKTFDDDGITKQNLLDMCKTHDDFVKKKKPHPLTEEQTKQQQLNEKNQKENSAKKQQIKKDKKEELKNIINTDGNNEYS